MDNVEMNIGISAEYDLLLQRVVTDASGAPVYDGDGNVIPLGGPRKVHTQKNLITNTGMNWFGSGDMGTQDGFGLFCRVGGGSTEPAFTDTALASQIASVQGPSYGHSASWGTGDYLNNAIISRVYTFPVGAAAGNLTEIGLGQTSSDTLLTRSLFKSSGVPVTIVVASDEQLIVNYRIIFRAYTTDVVFNPPPTSPTPTSYTLTMRPANLGVGSIKYSGRFGAGTSNSGQRVYYGATSGLGPITGVPSGTSGPNDSVTVTYGTYTQNSFERTDKYKINTTSANFANIGAIMFNNGIPFEWQLGISPRLTKVAPETIEITILNKWSRT